MARSKGMFQFAANFEVKNAAALDPRMVVATKAELFNKETWPYDGETAYLYNGLVVAVTEENELYMLIDSANYAAEASWKKVSAQTTVIEDSLNSESTTSALSAKQGKVLKGLIDAIPSYEIAKTENGYKLVTEEGGEAKGEIISFSDLVVKSGEVVEVEGVLTLRLTLTNDDTIDIPATSLVDVYTSNDKYIDVTNNKIGLNIDVLKTDLNIPVDLSEEVAALTAAVGDGENGLVKSVAENTTKIGAVETALSSKVEVSEFNILQAAVSGNTADIEAVEELVNEHVTKIGDLETKVDVDSVSGAIAAAIAPYKVKGLVAGNNITVTETANAGEFKIGVTGLTADQVAYSDSVTVKAQLDALSDSIEAAVAGGVTSITAGLGITVDSTSKTMPIVGIKVKENSAISVDEEGLDLI